MAAGTPETGVYTVLQNQKIRWNGLEAVYSVRENAIMRELTRHEQDVVHTLKALCGGEIMEPGDDALQAPPAASEPQNDEGPAPAAPPLRRRRGEPIVGQTTIAI